LETNAARVEPRPTTLRIRGRDGLELPDALEHVLRRHVEWVLAQSRTFSEAAQRMGIDVTTLWRMRRRWRLN
jgi:hypothetical protein